MNTITRNDLKRFPLLQGHFYVLALDQKKIRLYRGDADDLHEVDMKGMPTNLADALQFHDLDEPLTYRSRRNGGTWTTIFHVGIDDFKDDLVLLFRRVDQGLHKLIRTEDAVPLILAGAEFLWPIYRKANSYSHLAAGGIAGNPERWTPEELHDKAWALVEANFSG
jgi:hypothetical protein